MIVLDTHAWIWLADAPSKLGRAARKAIDAADELGVCSISAWEIATLVRKGRLELDRPTERWVSDALSVDRITSLVLTAEVATMAGSFGDDFHGDPADRIIAATALHLGAPLVTKDENLRAMPTLRCIW